MKEAVLNRREKRSGPDRAFVITFDDGYQSVYNEAFPLLRQYGMSATIFLAVGEHGSVPGTDRLPSLGHRPILSWEGIREMQRGGFIFAAHTLTHPNLTRPPFDRMETEIVRSKVIIEEGLGSTGTSFAYPYGRDHPQSYAIAQQWFSCACSDKLGLTAVHSDPYALESADAYYLNTNRLFEMMLSKWFPHYIAARNIPRRIRRAIKLAMGF